MVSVELKLSGPALTGTVKSVQPSRADVPLSKSTYTAATGAVHMEAEAKNPQSGAAVHYIIDGKLENLGAFQRFITGTWTQGSAQRRFQTH
jgi:hypothetical protein